MLYSYSYVITGVENRAIRGDSYTLPVLPLCTRMEIVQWRENHSLFTRNMDIFHIHIAQQPNTAEKIVTQESTFYIIKNYLICGFD
jgi:hypothetical protein